MNTNAQLDVDLANLKRLMKRARSSAAKAAWRACMLERTARIGFVLGIAMNAVKLVRDARRVRVPEGWSISVRWFVYPIMTVASHTSGRSIAQLQEPIPVRVHRSHDLDMVTMRLLAEDGLVRLEIDPEPA